MAINWNGTTKAEDALIRKIALRALSVAQRENILQEKDDIDFAMDVTGCHVSGCKLDLQKLFKADDATFGHDVFGIGKFINKETGDLTQGFLPRCSAKQ